MPTRSRCAWRQPTSDWKPGPAATTAHDRLRQARGAGSATRSWSPLPPDSASAASFRRCRPDGAHRRQVTSHPLVAGGDNHPTQDRRLPRVFAIRAPALARLCPPMSMKVLGQRFVQNRHRVSSHTRGPVAQMRHLIEADEGGRPPLAPEARCLHRGAIAPASPAWRCTRISGSRPCP